MAETLEEDFAKTSDELVKFKEALAENGGDIRNTKVAQRMRMMDKENRGRRGNEAAAADASSATKTWGRGGGGKRGGADWGTEAEDDLKECWGLIDELTKQLY
jgi:hypothetical protein